jgi:predicted permease
LSFTLLIGAGLFVRSLRELATLDPGFRRENVLLLTVQPELTGYSKSQLDKLGSLLASPGVLERLEAVAGVHSASLSSFRQFGDRPQWRMPIKLLDEPTQREDRTGASMRWVTPKHFETLGIPVLRGRSVGTADTFSSPKVGVLNETMARQYFGEQDPIGRRFKLTSGLEVLGEIEVIGVAKDTRAATLRDGATAMFYLPFAQFPNTENLVFALRATGNLQSVMLGARREIESLDPNLTISKVTTLSAVVDASLVQERALATLSAGFGGLALLLAAIGLYGVLAYAVTQRTREIGLRVALGAQRWDVLSLVMGQGLKLALLGAVIGLAGAFGVTRLVSALLYGVTPTDPATFISVSLLLLMVVTVASWLPARRAARVDPMVALRYE